MSINSGKRRTIHPSSLGISNFASTEEAKAFLNHIDAETSEFDF